MTIVTTTTSSGPYTAAAQTTFAVTFQSAGDGEIEVTLAGVVQASSLYAFTRAADGTGSVVFVAAVTGEVLIYSKPNFDQPASFSRFGAFYPDQINSPLDKAGAKALYLKTMLVPAASPSPASRANKFLQWDASGNPIAGGTETITTARDAAVVTVNAAGTTQVAAVTASGVAAATTATTQAGIATSAANVAQGMANFRATFAEAIAAFAVGTYFTSTASGSIRMYIRTSGAPYYVDQGDAAAPVSKTDFAATPMLPHLQRLLQKIANGNEDANVVLVGDSTGNETTEWFYLLAAALGTDYPTWTVKYALWNPAGPSYDVDTTIQTGASGRTLKFWNSSIAGAIATRMAGDNFKASVSDPLPDLLFISYGHNGGAIASNQLDYAAALASRIRTDTPDVPTVVIGQNPEIGNEQMADKGRVLRAFAARNGFGFIDVHAAFKQSSIPLASLMADTVHPNAAGSAIWRDTVRAAFRASKQDTGGGAIQPATLLRAWSSYGDFSEWTPTFCAMTMDVTNYETLGHSAAVACSGAAAGWISQQIISSTDIKAVRGKWITFAVWQRVPSGNDGTSGRIDLVDSGGTTTAQVTVQGVGFALFTCTMKVDAAATGVTAYIYPSAAAVANTIQIDRASLSLGLTAVDVVPAFGTANRKQRTFGSDTAGIGQLCNTATSAAGYRYTLTYNANPATAWVSDFAADGFFAKQAADNYARVSFTQAGVRFGDGTAAPTLEIAYRLSDGLGCSGNWYPQSNGVQKLGASGVAWLSCMVTSGFYVGANQVVGAQGAAVTDAAVLTSVNATNAAAAPTQAEFNAFVAEFNKLRTDLGASRTQLNTALARLRSHGLIA